MKLESIKLNVDTSEIISQIEGLQSIVDHYRAIPVLIQGIKSYMSEPYRTQVLADWDELRTKGVK